MAADISIVGSSILEITGTDANDQITIENTTYTTRSINYFTGEVYSNSIPAIKASIHNSSGVTQATYLTWQTYISNINVYGLDGNDTIENETEIPSRLWGQGGNDVLLGGSADDMIFGGEGEDHIRGHEGNDYLYGNEDNDEIWGYEGTDYLFGGSGEDYLSGGSESDTIGAGSGNDTVFGGSGEDSIHGGSGNDSVHGGTGDDRIFGEDGADTLNGANGDDLLDGGNHNDVLNGGWHDDELVGGSGNDFLDGSSGSDDLSGESGNDRLEGGSGNDRLEGGSGNDRLYGQSDNDELDGNGGDDGLYGGNGTDTLTGGTGDDRFLRLYDQSTPLGRFTKDTVRDRSSRDAEIEFYHSVDSILSTYTGKSWTQAEIEEIDDTFDILVRRTGNTDLIQRSNGSDIEVHRYGVNTKNENNYGVNNGYQIGMFDGAFNGNSSVSTYIMLHEIGHFWDSQGENNFIDDFRDESGWKAMPWFGGPPNGHTESGDGLWYYDNGTDFVSSYASKNPKEDWAESFAVNMIVWAGYLYTDDWAGLSGVSLATVTAADDKMEIVDDFVDSL